MKNGQTKLLIQFIDNHNLNRAKKFLKSPFFNQQPALVNLYEHYRDTLNQAENNLPNEALFEKLYPLEAGQAPDSRRRRKKVENTISDLGLAMEQFLAVSALQKDTLKQAEYVIGLLSGTSLEKLFYQKLNKFGKEIHETPFGYRRHYARYKYFEALLTFSLVNKTRKADGARLYKDMLESWEKAYLCIRLKLAVNALQMARMFDVEPPDESDIRATLLQAAPYADKNNPDINLSHMLGLLVTVRKDDPSFFSDVLELMMETWKSIEIADLQDMVVLLQNFCTARHNEGNSAYLPLKFKIDKWSIDEEVLVVKGEELPDETFLDLVITGLGIAGQRDIVIQFIEKNQKRIRKSRQRDAVALAMAYYHFTGKEFEKALLALKGCKAKEPNYVLRKQTLSPRLAYECYARAPEQYETAVTALHAFRRYLARNNTKIESARKKAYLRLAWFLNELIEVRYNPLADPAKSGSRLLSELDKKPVMVKTWVRQKIEELTNGQ